MEVFGFFIGILITIIAYVFLKAKESTFNSNREWYYAKWLSKDKEPQAYNGGYIIYANNSRWFLNTYVTWELYWVPFSLGDDLDELTNISSLEFRCTWLPDSKMFKIIKKIIYSHPNLK